MFVWGSTVHGELGLGGIEDEHVFTPRPLNWYEANRVVCSALGDYHTLHLTSEGKIYSCGSNDYGQLGHGLPRKRPHPVSGLDAHSIKAVACGEAHSLALNTWGQVFAWGSDACGQLGHQLGQNIQSFPKIVKSLAKYQIVQIACGRFHSVALTNNGEILCWGGNSFAELGLGYTSPYESSPKCVTSLEGIPFALISCGSYHTFALSKSGSVFGWGKNTHGQLGVNDTTNKLLPTQLRSLRSIKVRYITCGDDFSIFLTMDGGVFSCGAGTYGQLGNGISLDVIVPTQVLELMGSTTTQVSCGRKHTLAFVPSRGRVYSFGVGGSGQLGLRKTTQAATPQVVLGPWVSPSGASVVPSNSSEKKVIEHIFAGGDRSIVTVKPYIKDFTPYDCRVYENRSQILEVDYDYLHRYLNISNRTTVDQDFLSYLEVVFRSLQCLNGSFLLENNEHYSCSSKNPGLNERLADKCFSLIARYENDTIKEMIWNGIVEDILPKLSASPPDLESLRVYLTIPFYHEFRNPRHYLKLQAPFAKAVLRLTKNPSRALGNWWRLLSTDYFEKLVINFKDVVAFILRAQRIPSEKTVFYDANLEAVLDILSFLNKLNHSMEGIRVSYDIFHLSDLDNYLDVRIDYFNWLTNADPRTLFLCNYPFIFDAHAKIQLLETDQSLQMRSAMSHAVQEALTEAIIRFDSPVPIAQFLILNVSRDHIVQDTLRELSMVQPQDLKKPLKVRFQDEEAEDAGGVKKEFLMLILREILDPKYGMFKEYEETRAIWFSENTFEDGNVFALIGIICGLAMYNFTIIDIPFPLALYKKLLDEPVGLNDVKGLSPTLHKSLLSLLDYEDDDFTDVFNLTFEINRDEFGEVKSIPLRPDGNNIPVTNSNKAEYVNLYVNYIFNESVKNQYNSFHDGFMRVCGGRVLKLFHSEELMSVVVGNENYDWHALEGAAEYKNGYTSSTQTIKWFWEVLHEMSLTDKKKFLLFLTGSYRIPIKGMGAIKIIIQRTNDEKYLPVAHTCFNLLDLPQYKTKERLKFKLTQAIQQTEGFSLV
ncbi:hypothetical protein WA026_016561 [Henosepilachna vigintioctopunctata]|uniref:E3 ubiquitin-protein ligase HERC4 n=1 Tax=Henosepilachna vigintioctopunctata TaxID=420089 RepID=A0AAW1VDX2_9CUCU